MSTVLDDPDRLDLTGTIQISRSDPERWVRRARISISMGELEQAREDLHIALQLDPDCLEARLELLRVDAQLDRLQEELYDQDPWMAVSVHGPGQGLTGRRRAFFEANVATTCPTIAAVEAIASWVGRQTVLEVGAGRGLWSRLLADRGVEMLTTESPRRLDDLSTWTHVLALEPERAVTALSAEVLLVDAHSGVLPDVLARFRGRAAVVLSTGSTALEEGLAASWSCVQTVRLPSFGERPERLRFFVRRHP
ncbi:MAG: tetratricopeptide repeat protein [Alphaproteobacteria bacterium]|nr:tetratricopeptide repeat protein [Alphaproteobacteria bacterium]